jgi:hypothetical protein
MTAERAELSHNYRKLEIAVGHCCACLPRQALPTVADDPKFSLVVSRLDYTEGELIAPPSSR